MMTHIFDLPQELLHECLRSGLGFSYAGALMASKAQKKLVYESITNVRINLRILNDAYIVPSKWPAHRHELLASLRKYLARFDKIKHITAYDIPFDPEVVDIFQEQPDLESISISMREAVFEVNEIDFMGFHKMASTLTAFSLINVDIVDVKYGF
jgi:hypothetical protein